MELMVGVLAYVYRDQVEADLNYNLNETFVQKYGIEPLESFAIDKMQQEVYTFFILHLIIYNK